MRRRLAALLLLLPLVAGAADRGCTIVYGHGRNPSPDDPGAEAMWDGANAAFNSGVVQTLAAAGWTAVPLVLRVSATDRAANATLLLAEARLRGCRQVVETALFADESAGSLVARLRRYPIVATAGGSRIGAIDRTLQREFDLGPGTFDRLRPAPLGEQLARELLAEK